MSKPAAMVPNIFVTGSSGAGKSHYIKTILPFLKTKTRYLVVLNTSKQLSQFCNKTEYIGEDEVKRRFDPKKIAEVIKKCGSLHVELLAEESAQFLEALALAIWSFGVFESEKLQILVVVDECDNFLSREAITKTWRRLEKEGRKYGIGIIKASQQLASPGADTIHSVVRRQARFFVIFTLSDDAERARIMRLASGIPDPGELLMPDLVEGLPPEYLVYNKISGECVQMLRSGKGHTAVFVKRRTQPDQQSRIKG
jgi:hypothetical protein